MSANLLASSCEHIAVQRIPLSLPSEELTFRELTEEEQRVVDFAIPKNIDSLNTQQIINFVQAFLQVHQGNQQESDETRSQFNKLRARHAGLVAGVEALRSSNRSKKQSARPQAQLNAWAEDLSRKENDLLRLSEEEQRVRSTLEDLQTHVANLESVKLGQKSKVGAQESLPSTQPEVKALIDELDKLKKLCGEYEAQAKRFEVEKDKACEDDSTLQTLIDQVGAKREELTSVEEQISETAEGSEELATNIRKTIHSCTQEAPKHSQSWGMAFALQTLIEKGPSMPLGEFKSILSDAFPNEPTKVLQVLYTLSGNKLIQIDRSTVDHKVHSLLE